MDSSQNGNNGSNNQKLPKPKATWNYELHKTFVELCHGELGNKQGTFFSKDAWTNIINEFNKRHGKGYDKKQMKNHWDNTKAEWKIWYRLKDSESGLGWDEERNTIIATDEWWKDYIQGCPDALKFRFKGIDHSTKLTELFLEGMATGKSAWAPSQGSLPNDNASPLGNTEAYSEHEVVDVESDSQVRNDEPMVGSLKVDATNSESNKRKRQLKKREDIKPSHEPRRRTTSTMAVNQNMDRICGAIETFANRPRSEPKLESKVESKTDITIKDCIKLLDQLEDVPKGSELYLFGCRLFLLKKQREMFAALDIDVRRPWLEDTKRKPPKNI